MTGHRPGVKSLFLKWRGGCRNSKNRGALSGVFELGLKLFTRVLREFTPFLGKKK